MLIDMVCDFCNKPFQKSKGEVNRQIKRGRKYFFCSLSCGASWNNLHRPNARIEVEKVCPFCGNTFKTMTGAKSATYCSSSCASKGSMSDSRREAQRQGGIDKKENLISASEILKKRENWKYQKIKKLLVFLGEEFEFEYDVPPYIFDLCLIKRKILIELDGAYHSGKQNLLDETKQKFAEERGWKVYRIKVPTNNVIAPEFLYKILK